MPDLETNLAEMEGALRIKGLEPTPRMRQIAELIDALQAEYDQLEVEQQAHAVHKHLKEYCVAARAEEENLEKLVDEFIESTQMP